MKKRKIVALSILAGGMLLSSTVQAQTVEGMRKSLIQANQNITNDIGEKQSLQTQVESIQKSIVTVQAGMEDNQKLLQQKESELQKTKQQLNETQKELKKYQELFNKRLCVLYEKGTMSYVDILLESNGLEDFLNRMDGLVYILQSDKKIVDRVTALKENLDTQTTRVQAEEKQYQSKEQELQALSDTYKSLEKENEQKYADIQTKINMDTNSAQEIQSEIEFATQESQYALANPIQDEGHIGQSSFTGSQSQLISYAQSFIGTPYQWGGTTPSGFDCSGYTQYVMSKFGVSLSRTAQGQYNQGKSISDSDLQPGDLVFFSTYGPGATHVGIYMGSGLMINAEDKGVRIDNIHDPYYWGPRYIGAKRVI